MFFGFPPIVAPIIPKGLSKTSWSKGITHDGYYIRADQSLYLNPDRLPTGVAHCEKVAGVDKDGKAYSKYPGSVLRGEPFALENWVTEIDTAQLLKG